MNTDKAVFLANQLTPILKKSKVFIRRLEVDTDNEDIKMINLLGATIYRVHYGSRNLLEVSNEIIENVRC